MVGDEQNRACWPTLKTSPHYGFIEIRGGDFRVRQVEGGGWREGRSQEGIQVGRGMEGKKEPANENGKLLDLSSAWGLKKAVCSREVLSTPEGGRRVGGEPMGRLLVGGLKTWCWSLGRLVVTSYFPQHGESQAPSIPARLWAEGVATDANIWGGDIRGRGRPRGGRSAPLLALGAGRGACSPLRVGNGRPPETWLYVQRIGCGRRRLCTGC